MNYDRYKKPVRKGLLDKLTVESKWIIRRRLSELRNLRILDVGIGTAPYGKLLLDNGNKLTGVDQNPHLCKLPIKVRKADATDLKGTFDVVIAIWLSEYLSPMQMGVFLQQASKVADRIILTVIPKTFLGWLYIFLAKVKRIRKYNHSLIQSMSQMRAVGFSDIAVERLPDAFGMPWAYLLTGAKK